MFDRRRMRLLGCLLRPFAKTVHCLPRCVSHGLRDCLARTKAAAENTLWRSFLRNLPVPLPNRADHRAFAAGNQVLVAAVADGVAGCDSFCVAVMDFRGGTDFETQKNYCTKPLRGREEVLTHPIASVVGCLVNISCRQIEPMGSLSAGKDAGCFPQLSHF